MRNVLFNRMEFEQIDGVSCFKGVPVAVADTGFDGTVEIIVGLAH
jgi:hypothetical protein